LKSEGMMNASPH